MAERLTVYVYAHDAVTRTGIAVELRGRPELRVVGDADVDEAVVSVVAVDEAAMRSGVHVVRNPHVYARLSDAGLVTRAGTGVRRMSRLVREATGRDLQVEVRPFEVLVSLPRHAPSR